MSLLFNVKNLSIRRAGIRILDGINWTVNAGEHWAILGANGSGKTNFRVNALASVWDLME